MNVIFVRRATIAALLAVIGCVTGRGGGTSGAPVKDWNQTLAEAESAAIDHRYADADRMLSGYATQYPGSTGAIESSYWRGVIALEPANRDASPQIAAALFETYNKNSGALPHRLEAEILRNLALHLQSLTASAVAASAAPSAAPGASPGAAAADRGADLKAKDAEIQRLKDELAKANDELERIKRRLTAPTKP